MEPCSIRLSDQPMDCHLHPEQPLVAVGLISGRLQAYRFSDDDTANASDTPSASDASVSGKKNRAGGKAAITSRKALGFKAHKESCRAVRFSPDGALLISGSADGSMMVVDVAAGRAAGRLRGQSSNGGGGEDSDGDEVVGVSRLEFTAETVLASGDDEGVITLWDTRARTPVACLAEHTDYIADMAMHPLAAQPCLMAASADGTLSSWDLRTNTLRTRSEEDADDEVLCCCAVKGGRKVVAGSTSGVLNLFSWGGAMAGPSDRFPGHPGSVDAVVSYDDDTVITGCSDGALRLVSILPNKLLGVFGGRAGAVAGGGRSRASGGYPIERLSLGGGGRWLAVASHEEALQLWDMAAVLGGEEREDEGEEGGAEDSGAMPSSTEAAAGESDSDADSEDDRKAKKGSSRRKKRRSKGDGDAKLQKRGKTPQSFFSGLL